MDVSHIHVGSYMRNEFIIQADDFLMKFAAATERVFLTLYLSKNITGE